MHRTLYSGNATEGHGADDAIECFPVKGQRFAPEDSLIDFDSRRLDANYFRKNTFFFTYPVKLKIRRLLKSTTTFSLN
jgi:hypothetical protein